MKKHILSKSTFMYGCQCPKRLFLHKFKPELANPEDEAQESIFAAGTDVGLLAHNLFKGGVNAQPPDSFSYHLSVEKTKEFIASGEKIIYEAAFNYNGVLCAIDILVNENGKWYAYEVKGSTKVKDPFIMDASLQYYVITHSGITLDDMFIVHLNNQYVRKGELDYQSLFNKQSILNEVVSNQQFIEEKIDELKLLLKNKKEPIIEPGDQCFTPYECNFTNHCWKDYDDEVVDYGNENYNKQAIDNFLNELNYPLHFFDFETIMPAVPEFDESRPYQQIPFQYSLHIKSTTNSRLKHFYYLGDGKSDPRVDLIEQLIKHLNKKGSIIVWNKTFEISRLKEIARDFPSYENAIKSIIDRVVDLMVPFRNKTIQHPDFKGSYSIKKVLPVMVPELSYDNLEISNGGDASAVYAAMLQGTFEGDTNKTREALLKYCELDTFAMVEILRKMNVLISKY